MALTKRTYVDGETVITAENLNDIQDEIIANGTAIVGKTSETAVAPVEASTTATNAYSIGDLFFLNNTLYEATAAIAIGGTITVGTNCKATTVAEVQDSLKAAITELNNDKADVIISSASGSIASFSDGADNLPVEDLVVAIDPSQDLHGYDYPWPAGGGKNLLPMTVDGIKGRNGGTSAWTGNTRTLLGITVTIQTDSDGNVTGILTNGTATGDFVLYLVADDSTNYFSLVSGTSYIITSGVSNDSGGNYTIRVGNSTDGYVTNTSGGTATFTADTQNAVRIAIGSGKQVSNVLWKPMIRLASVSDATFAPYSNICPITGWTGCNVTRTGKNLLDVDDAEIGKAWNGDNNANRARIIVPCSPNMTYTLSMNGTNSTDGIFYGYYESTPALAGVVTFPLTFTTANNSNYIVIGINKTNITKADVENLKLQIELGSTTSSFTPFVAYDIIPISWQSSAGTVYGGTLDVTTGVLRVDKGIATADLFTGSARDNDSGLYYSDYDPGNAENAPLKSLNSHYEVLLSGIAWLSTKECCSITSRKVLRIFHKETTLSEWQIVASNMQFVYPLDTPVEYTLTAQQLTTLLGENNIWHDANGETSVEYRADTKLYIQKLTQPTEDDMTANSNIANGTFFMVGNSLYLSTAAILAGDPIKPGTNCTALSLADALNNLNT